MKILVFVLALLLPLSAQAAANLAAAPIGRMDLQWWHYRFEQTLAAGKADPDAKVIWLGDSITQYWQREGTLGYDNIIPVWRHHGEFDLAAGPWPGDRAAPEAGDYSDWCE
jgi:hypothetical protein